jgi:hypothetical protein
MTPGDTSKMATGINSFHRRFAMPRQLPRGLDGRTRDQNPPKAGEIRQKRADTLVGTLRQEYGDNFAKGYRSDTKLGTVRDDTDKSLHRLVKDTKK